MKFITLSFIILLSFFHVKKINAYTLPENHYKVLVVKKVYESLALTIFNHQKQDLPRIEIKNREKFIAKYYRLTNRIVIEEKAYNICQKMGADSINALSVIIGHEFAHYLYHQVQSDSSCIKIEKDDKFRFRLQQEQEADLYGLFTAYLAHYDVIEVAPKILNKLYRAYKFQEHLPNYDPLKVRQRANTAAIKKLKKLIHIFETANYLTAIGDYTKATVLYRTILKNYKNFEIYNNLSVATILDAIDLSSNINFPFVYPLELNLSSRLYKCREPFGTGFPSERKKMLEEAKKYLIKAMEYDPYSVSIQINLACVNNMLGNSTRTLNNLEKATQFLPSKVQKGHIEIIYGIVYENLGQQDLAKQKFEKVIQDFSGTNQLIAQTNLQILKGNPLQSERYSQEVKEHIGSRKIEDLKNYPNRIPLDLEYILRYDKKNKTSFSLINRSNTNKTYLIRTRNKKEYTSTQIGIGTSENKVREIYKHEIIKNIPTDKGSFIVIPTKGLIFFIGSQSKVKEWGIFKM